MITKSDIRRFDIESFLRHEGYDLHHTGDEYYTDCFKCGGENKFYVNSITKYSNCKRCGFKSKSIMYLLSSITGMSYHQVEDMVTGNEKEIRVRKSMILDETPEITITLPEFYKPVKFPLTDENRPYWEYLVEKRGVLPEVIQKYKLGYCDEGKYAKRIIVPVYWNNELVSWVGRSILPNSKRPKTTPKGNHQSRYLFNADILWNQRELCLVEGPFDMLKAPDILCASFGKQLSQRQFNIIRELNPDRVTLMYDNDAIGDKLAVASRIAEITNCYVADLPGEKDPGDLTETEIKILIKQAKPFEDTMLMDYNLEQARNG